MKGSGGDIRIKEVRAFAVVWYYRKNYVLIRQQLLPLILVNTNKIVPVVKTLWWFKNPI